MDNQREVTVVIKDAHGDVHARRFAREQDPNKIGFRRPLKLFVLQCAHEMADDLGLDEGETVRYGISSLTDVGAARLDMTNVQWLDYTEI